MKNKMYVFMNPKATIGDLYKACDEAQKGEYGVICVPQWFVNSAASKLEGVVKVATIVGLPGGTTTTFAKFAEAKQAVNNGADEVIVPVNMVNCAEGDFALARNDLSASMYAEKKGAVTSALIDAESLSKDQLKETVSMCKALNLGGRILIAHADDDAIEEEKEATEKVEKYIG